MFKKFILIGIICISFFSFIGCEETENKSINKVSNVEKSNTNFKLQHGELLEEHVYDNLLVIKAKIEPSYSNKSTINQNGFNIENIIQKQNGDKFKEIQYWAVADMQSGEESKVISFSLKENLIKDIKNKNIPGNQIVENAEDVWIHQSLLNE